MGGVMLVHLETVKVLLMLLSILGQEFYKWVVTCFNRENKKLKRYIIVIDELKLNVYLFDNNKNFHGFVSRYNLKQKYIALIPSYNLEIEN